MFTAKQKLRKLPTRSQTPERYRFNALSTKQEPVSPVSVAVSSDSPISLAPSNEEQKLPDDVATATEQKQIRRKVRFDNLVSVTLIPSITEYKDARCFSSIWSDQNEVESYKNEVFDHIKGYLNRNRLFSNPENQKIALNLLCRCPEEFEPIEPIESNGAKL